MFVRYYIIKYQKYRKKAENKSQTAENHRVVLPLAAMMWFIDIYWKHVPQRPIINIYFQKAIN